MRTREVIREAKDETNAQKILTRFNDGDPLCPVCLDALEASAPLGLNGGESNVLYVELGRPTYSPVPALQLPAYTEDEINEALEVLK